MKPNPEFENFNRAMDAILKADPTKVRAEMEADKQRRAQLRKTKKQPSARASNGKG